MKDGTKRVLVVVGCAVLFLIVTCGGLVGGGLYVLTRLTRSAPVQAALEHAESDPRVAARLGTPLEPALPPRDLQIAYRSGGVRVELDLRIRGPRGDGELVASGAQDDDEPWVWHRFTVRAGDDSFDLSTPAPPASDEDR